MKPIKVLFRVTHPFRRRQYVIDQDFQFRYIGIFVGLTSMLFLVFVISAKYYINLNINPLIESGMITSPALGELITVEKHFLSKNLLTIFLILISLLTLAGIYITHRIAGPVFALKRHMKTIIREGVPDKPLQIRKTDEFQDLIITFNSMIRSLQQEHHLEKNDKRVA